MLAYQSPHICTRHTFYSNPFQELLLKMSDLPNSEYRGEQGDSMCLSLALFHQRTKCTQYHVHLPFGRPLLLPASGSASTRYMPTRGFYIYKSLLLIHHLLAI